MKIKMFTLLFALSYGAAAFAQTGLASGTRFGHGEDSLRCLQNISIYTEFVKTNNFKDAYSPWKSVFQEAPVAQVSTYTNGAKILRGLIQSTKDATEQKNYLTELMAVHDQRIQYLDQLNTMVKKPTTRGAILGTKAHDMIAFSGSNLDVNAAYTTVKEAVELEKAESEYFVLQDFMDMSSKKLKIDDSHKEQFIQDYLTASGYADEAYKAATKEKDQQNLQTAKDNIDAYFINSGAATCENLQSIYGPKVGENKTNLEYLKQVINVMQLLRCTEEEAYFQASEYAHAIEPTAATAEGCGYMYYKKGDTDKALSYFDQAIELTEGAEAKADACYKAAVVLMAKKIYGRAKTYANKAISNNPNHGKAYILIAQMYAASPNWSDEKALNLCTYFAAIDKLQRAKSVDDSVTDEANELIRIYSAYTPKNEDLFFLGLQKGNSVTIGGWIGETTTIR